MRFAITLFVLVPVLAVADNDAGSRLAEDFHITLTGDGLCLCGEGFGGIHGCIDEAVSRGAKSVVISASSDTATAEVQELINAVHAVGFDRVGFETFDDADT